MIKDISTSVIKKDHDEKVSGEIQYVSDIKIEGMLYGVLYRSSIAYGKIKSKKLPLLPEGYKIIGPEDIPGANFVKIIEEDQPIFAQEMVNYIGEPLFMIVGEELDVLHELLEKVTIDYDVYKPIYTLDEAIRALPEVKAMAGYEFGEALEVLEATYEEAYEVFEEDYETGYQEHVYLEPQGMLGIYTEKEIIVKGSLQCPYYVKGAVVSALNVHEDAVRIIQSPTGGAFGGKEEFPSMTGCQVAIAAQIMKKPVMLLFDREEDMLVTTKRHPSKIKYKTALDKNGNILSMSIKIAIDGGANLGLSSVVIQRALINSGGVYNIPNFHAEGQVLKTNKVPTGAFRGFGAPQSFAGIESHMEHISRKLKMDPIDYKLKYLVKQGDSTVTKGRFAEPVLMKEMIDDLMDEVDYRTKKSAFAEFNKKNDRIKKGLGTSLFLHGCGFTGSGERDHIKARVKLVKAADNSVSIKIANVDMGQGLLTTMSKIVAKVLNLDYKDIKYPYPDTKEVPDSGPTVASRTTMIVGKLLERAAIRLKEKWIYGIEQQVIEDYEHDEGMIPWDEKTFSGDAYPAYSWGVNMVELEVDTLTGIVSLKELYGSFDIGKAIDNRIIKGQIEGGMVQGIGYGFMEKMTAKDGKIQQKTISDYAPPTSMDVVDIQSKIYDNPYAHGPFGAKGAGELTLVGGAPAVQSAIENALSIGFHQVPITSEVIIDRIK